MLVTETSLLAEQMRESISAMVDNEAQQIELQRVLKATEDEPAVRDQFAPLTTQCLDFEKN